MQLEGTAAHTLHCSEEKALCCGYISFLWKNIFKSLTNFIEKEEQTEIFKIISDCVSKCKSGLRL